MTSYQTHLVLGATGKTGRRVTSRLHDRAPSDTVRALSRPAFEWTDRQTWPTAVEGADTAYVVYVPDISFPGGPETVADFADLAARSGVRRLVLLSGRGEAEAERAERLFAEAASAHGAEWAVVRSAFFMQNFDESLFADPIIGGHVAFPADTVREPFVDLDDLAEVAVALLLGEAPAGQVYELTGPELLTFREAVTTIAEALGRPIAYEAVTDEEFIADLVDAGFPEEDAAGLAGIFAEVLDGRNEHLTDGVRRALGREPRSLADFAKSAVAGGAWPA